jgi:hypothetical protein
MRWNHSESIPIERPETARKCGFELRSAPSSPRLLNTAHMCITFRNMSKVQVSKSAKEPMPARMIVVLSRKTTGIRRGCRILFVFGYPDELSPVCVWTSCRSRLMITKEMVNPKEKIVPLTLNIGILYGFGRNISYCRATDLVRNRQEVVKLTCGR